MLLTYTPIWNGYMFMLSGKSHAFEKKNIDNDTLFLQESVVFQFLLLEIPQLVIKAVNHTHLEPQSVVVANYYLSLAISALAVYIGVVMIYFIATTTPVAATAATSSTPPPTMSTFYLRNGSYDILLNNQEIQFLNQNFLLSKIIPIEVEITAIKYHQVINKCFFNQTYDIVAKERNFFNSVRKHKKILPLGNTIQGVEIICNRIFLLLLQDSCDSSIYNYFKAKNIQKPTDLTCFVTEKEIFNGILERINDRNTRKIVGIYLKLITPYRAGKDVGVRDGVVDGVNRLVGITTWGVGRMVTFATDYYNNTYHRTAGKSDGDIESIYQVESAAVEDESSVWVTSKDSNNIDDEEDNENYYAVEWVVKS